MGSIWLVCKNPGGTNGILPVYQELKTDGRDVCLVANGKAVQLLNSLNISFFTLEQVLEVKPKPLAVVTSMCNEGGVGRNLVPLLSAAQIPIIGLQDLWGGQLQSSWYDPIFRPTYICVNDELGAKIVKSVWPDFQENRICISGFPALDKYAMVDVDKIRAQVKATLGLEQDKKIVLHAGQVEREGEVISEVVSVLNEIKADIYFLPRPHPRMKVNAPAEIPKWEDALAHFTGGLLIDSLACNSPSIVAAADLVLSMFSTTNMEAACLRKNNISILYPEVGMRVFKTEYSPLTDFPLVELGCSVKATNREDLLLAIEQALADRLNLRKAQEKNFLLDGKNAQRVAKLVCGLI